MTPEILIPLPEISPLVALVPLIIAGVIYLALVYLGLKIKNKKQSRKHYTPKTTHFPDDTFPYFKIQFFFTQNEHRFFNVLVEAVKFQYITLSKVRLSDIIDVSKNLSHDEKNFYGTKINQKHIDFILLSPRDLSVVLAIELDDPSHDSPKAAKNDIFKNNALAAAQVPLLRVRTADQYSIEQLEYDINTKIRQHQRTNHKPQK